jgi:hypothetical protein
MGKFGKLKWGNGEERVNGEIGKLKAEMGKWGGKSKWGNWKAES